MVLLYLLLSQVGGYVREILYPFICLFCVWKDYPSFGKRQFKIQLFILLLFTPPLKAPGPNGYHAIFFQQNWHILGPGIIHAIEEIFETTTIPEDWDATNLVLIPKINH